MITVILRYANGQQEDVILAGIPRVGESVRIKNGLSGTALLVEHVLWMAGTDREPGPSVILVVRQHD